VITSATEARRSQNTPSNARRSRLLTASDLPALGRGCGVLGSGGGGLVDVGLMVAGDALARHGPVQLLDPDELDGLDPDGLVLPLASVGAPTVHLEQFSSGDEAALIRAEVERALGRPVVAVMSTEIGGTNGVEPVAHAATLGLPLLDADGMGRAFPEVYQVAMHVAGLPVGVVIAADVAGNVVTIWPKEARWAEHLSRMVCVAMGSVALTTDNIMRVSQVSGAVVPRTVSYALEIGAAVTGDERGRVSELVTALDGYRLLTGKIVDVERITAGGFARGAVLVEGMGEDRDRLLRVEFQNENLIAVEDGVVLVTVPDLITIVDAQTADAVACELLRYGQRVTIVVAPCNGIWRTDGGLAVVGPRAFGYDCDYVPVEQRLGEGREGSREQVV
jgi:DUF917 family protein